MIDGMRIILERMKTHPEEFINDLGQVSRWQGLVHMNDDILTDEEKKAFNDAIHELRRQRFTSRVLEVLMEEPVEIDPNTYTIKTAGRYTVTNNSYPTTTNSIADLVRKEQEAKMQESVLKEYLKNAAQQERFK